MLSISLHIDQYIKRCIKRSIRITLIFNATLFSPIEHWVRHSCSKCCGLFFSSKSKVTLAAASSPRPEDNRSNASIWIRRFEWFDLREIKHLPDPALDRVCVPGFWSAAWSLPSGLFASQGYQNRFDSFKCFSDSQDRIKSWRTVKLRLVRPVDINRDIQLALFKRTIRSEWLRSP